MAWKLVARIVRGQLQDQPVSKEEGERVLGKYFINEWGGSYGVTWQDQQLFATWTSDDGSTKPPIRLWFQGDGNYWIPEKGMNFRFDSERRSLTIQVDST